MLISFLFFQLTEVSCQSTEVSCQSTEVSCQALTAEY